MAADSRPSQAPPPAVPLLEACPACASHLEGQRCKVVCPNPACPLFRRIIENCAGD